MVWKVQKNQEEKILLNLKFSIKRLIKVKYIFFLLSCKPQVKVAQGSMFHKDSFSDQLRMVLYQTSNQRRARQHSSPQFNSFRKKSVSLDISLCSMLLYQDNKISFLNQNIDGDRLLPDLNQASCDQKINSLPAQELGQ